MDALSVVLLVAAGALFVLSLQWARNAEKVRPFGYRRTRGESSRAAHDMPTYPARLPQQRARLVIVCQPCGGRMWLHPWFGFSRN